jgi:hypothetical protein
VWHQAIELLAAQDDVDGVTASRLYQADRSWFRDDPRPGPTAELRRPPRRRAAVPVGELLQPRDVLPGSQQRHDGRVGVVGSGQSVQCVDGSPGGQPVGEQPAEVRVPGVDRLLEERHGGDRGWSATASVRRRAGPGWLDMAAERRAVRSSYRPAAPLV